jgi:hypothetical protein
MISETQLIKTLSESILGDFPAVLPTDDARLYAIEMFKKIFNIDQTGKVNSDLFYERINANPTVLSDTQIQKVEEALASLDTLVNVILPDKFKKLPIILDPDLRQDVPGVPFTPEIRAALIAERARLAEMFKVYANIPTVLSTTLID